MKIVSVTKYAYVAELDCVELDRLTGQDTPRCYGPVNADLIGRQFAIREAWDRLRELRNHQEDLPRITNKLRALADLLEPIQVEIPDVPQKADE